jgi:phosphoserine phosphatase RsbU/P
MPFRIGRVEWTFAALLALYVASSWVPMPFTVTAIISLALLVAGGWAFLRFTRTLVQHLLWRLRNRLIVAYVFIALVPVVLITMLVGLGASLTGGQLTIYLVTAELERRTAALQNSTEFLARNSPGERMEWVQTVAPYLNTRFPGLQLAIDDSSRWTYPAGAAHMQVPGEWKPGSGVVVRDGILYVWAHSQNSGRRVTALVPLTREFLGQMAPDMCESTIRDLARGKILVHPSLPEAGISRNRLPPAVNRLDFEIRWGAPIPVSFWEDPKRADTEWLTVRTRLSAVLRTVFAQKVDWASDVIPMLFFSVAILFLFAEVVALIIGVSITRTITGAVHDLYQGTLRVRSGDFSHRIPANGRDQLAELAVSFNQMTENMQRLLVIEKERERLQAELEIAREVQNQLYPTHLPEIASVQLTAACSPARMVSGDYYDYQKIGEGKVAIAIGDVAGKGISAALLMATIQSSFRSQIRGSLEMAVTAGPLSTRVTVSTSGLVSHLNTQLFADTSPEKYATFYLGVYDEATTTLTYTNAGHLPPVLVRNGTAARLDVNGMVVGAFPFANYGESQLQLLPGDLIVFFTDGISEPENEYGEMFGEERLEDLVVKNAHRENREIIESIMDAVRQWTGSDELQDDMTLLLLRRR